METIRLVEKEDCYVPKAALTIYEARISHENMVSSKVYVELHRVDDRGNILAGKPLTEKFANALGKQLFKQSQVLTSGRIPRNLLHIAWEQDMPVLVWYTEPTRTEAYYTKELHIPDGKIHVPYLLWKFDFAHRSLDLWALMEPPTDESKIYHAPFHNVYDRGDVCLGSGRYKGKITDFKSVMTAAETLFWRTKFSAIHNTKACVGNLNSLHKELVAGAPFPTDKLIATTLKLKDICR